MGQTTRILIVDDDPDICIMIRMMLQYKGYQVTVIENPGMVIELLKPGEIDIILMDMLLAGLNGINICTAIKQNETTSHIPLIMMSAHSDAEYSCLEAGANDFIAKPFEINELLEKVKNAEVLSLGKHF